jgi:hypothetical protein
MEDVFFDSDLLSMITEHLNYHDVIRLMSVNKDLSAILLPIQERMLAGVLRQASNSLITLRATICFNPSDNKSLNLCIQQMRERKLNALKNLIVDNWYVFHINSLYTTAFVSLLLDKTLWFHNLFYTQKWFKYPEFQDLSKHIHIHFPERYTKYELIMLSQALNIPKKRLLSKPKSSSS